MRNHLPVCDTKPVYIFEMAFWISYRRMAVNTELNILPLSLSDFNEVCTPRMELGIGAVYLVFENDH